MDSELDFTPGPPSFWGQIMGQSSHIVGGSYRSTGSGSVYRTCHVGEHNTGSQGMGVGGRAAEHAALGPFRTTVHALDGGGKALGLLMGMWNLD